MNVDVIKKRDGSLVPFDISKIENAVFKSMDATKSGGHEQAKKIAKEVKRKLTHFKGEMRTFVPDVEGIQDTVERTLIWERYSEAAKAYILYRERRNKLRDRLRLMSPRYKELSRESKKYFDSVYSEIVFLRTYARWIPEEGRRETWIECVDRFMDFMKSKLKDKLSPDTYAEVRDAILKQEVLPSMRLMQFAGPAVENTNVAAYNCAFLAPTEISDFAEALYILMCGTGLGFSVEEQVVGQLPVIEHQTGERLPTFVIPDSKEGWADSLKHGMKAWYAGKDIDFDYSKIRPKGARLKTFGGKASGPDPLRDLLQFTKTKILNRQRKRLRSIDVHDILTKTAEIVVVGGVRRSAEMSLSDLDDAVMRDAKKGYFFFTEPQRKLANNSAVYNEKPSDLELLNEWTALIESNSGERGIFNRGGLIKTLPRIRREYLEKIGIIKNGKIVGILGTNPCGEIILKSHQFCNLSEVICRADDDLDSLARKVGLATLLGTFQATLTDFGYLSDKWKQNCKDERLLGVSLTGQWDCNEVRDPAILRDLKQHAISENIRLSEQFGINPSHAVTTVKPSGTVSQLVNAASGCHARFAPYYIRRIRIAASDATCQMLRDQGVPHSPEVGEDPINPSTYVFDFPVKSPEGAVHEKDLTAIEQLEHWKIVKLNYTDHNPSVTIYVGPDEWISVLSWLRDNWDYVGGLSFLPRNDSVYQLAPYEAVDEKRYRELSEKVSKVNVSQLPLYETFDQTEQKRELACAGGACEL